ncbi:MAG: T9SS type A sorting domain-containing protein [Bacteroidetes bacterium]|nr:T9SS type A sorting domain-containing protein [Bacteroidota bacterium]
MRLVTSTPALTSTANSADLTIVNVSSSIAPTTVQNILSNTNGTPLAVTESNGSVGRNWKYSNISGGPYSAIVPAQTGLSYTPYFQAGGTYFVVCETNYPGGLNVISNEVQVDVIGNNITPSAPQTLTINTNGNTLTVNETAPATAREWKFTTTQGTNYVSFTPAQTGTTYTPNFSSNGTYFVVCVSDINGVPVTSNEVEITVGTPILTTGTFPGSPFEFSLSAPDANIVVPYNTTTAVFDYNTNVFTAQLSDANGSFTNATNIGSIQSGAPGSINAVIPANTPAGTGYRVRVISSVPVIYGTNNGVDLIIDQFENSVLPSSDQSILYNTNGTTLTVIASQNATHEWKYSTTSGSGYTSFNPAQTATTYTPNFSLPGTYYVVCVSRNQYSDDVTSNEVMIEVLNGSTITTQSVSGSPYLVSPSANVQIVVPFSSDAVFNSANIFKAQLSDNTGSFASPVEIGTLSGNSIAPISAVIPNSSVYGAAYRIRVVSTDPAIVGSDNGTDLTIIPFEISVAPSDTQTLLVNTPGTAVTVTESHPSTRTWLYSDLPGTAYQPFSPAQTLATLVPQFNTVGVYYVICRSTNAVNDNINSQEIIMIVTEGNGIDKNGTETIKMFWSAQTLTVDLSDYNSEPVSLELIDMNGQVVLRESLNSQSINKVTTDLPNGVYVFRINSQTDAVTGKIAN